MYLTPLTSSIHVSGSRFTGSQSVVITEVGGIPSITWTKTGVGTLFNYNVTNVSFKSSVTGSAVIKATDMEGHIATASVYVIA
jgi:hypothetical protein